MSAATLLGRARLPPRSPDHVPVFNGFYTPPGWSTPDTECHLPPRPPPPPPPPPHHHHPHCLTIIIIIITIIIRLIVIVTNHQLNAALRLFSWGGPEPTVTAPRCRSDSGLQRFRPQRRCHIDPVKPVSACATFGSRPTDRSVRSDARSLYVLTFPSHRKSRGSHRGGEEPLTKKERTNEPARRFVVRMASFYWLKRPRQSAAHDKGDEGQTVRCHGDAMQVPISRGGASGINRRHGVSGIGSQSTQINRYV